MKVLLKR